MSWTVRVTVGMSIVTQHDDAANKHAGRFFLMAVRRSWRVHGDVRVLERLHWPFIDD